MARMCGGERVGTRRLRGVREDGQGQRLAVVSVDSPTGLWVNGFGDDQKVVWAGQARGRLRGCVGMAGIARRLCG